MIFGKKNGGNDYDGYYDYEEDRVVVKDNSGNTFVAGVLTGLIVAFLLLFVIMFVGKNDDNDTNNNLNNSGSNNVQTNIDDKMIEIANKIAYIRQLFKNTYYYDMDDEELAEAIYDAMLASLDDKYAAYYNAEEFLKMIEQTTGQYCGIGVTVQQNPDTMEITALQVNEDTPAYKAGIRVGDIIIGVDGVDVSKMDLSEVVTYIKGEEFTTVKVKVRRGEEEMEFEVTREVIHVDSVAYEMIDDIAYIYISSFDTDETAKQFKAALDFAKENNAKGLMLDLRSNPGGDLNAVTAMLDMIIPKGELLVYVEYKGGIREDHIAKEDVYIDLPIVALVDEYSASGSELFVGALKDYSKAVIIGKTTYGKGVGQTFRQIGDGTALKFTTFKYFLPSGTNIDGVGVVPDIEVDLNEDAVGENGIVIREKDNQYLTAKEKLESMINGN